MRFLIDAHLPPALAQALRETGHEAIHVDELELRTARDIEIWDYPRTHGANLTPKDEDFVELFRKRRDAPVILWLRLGNASRRRLIEWFMPLLPQLVERLRAGDRFVEVR